ncbi:MAG: hypothetical protein ACJ73S_28110 [Mycobacteriales bacterium]
MTGKWVFSRGVAGRVRGLGFFCSKVGLPWPRRGAGGVPAEAVCGDVFDREALGFVPVLYGSHRPALDEAVGVSVAEPGAGEAGRLSKVAVDVATDDDGQDAAGLVEGGLGAGV